MNKAHTYEQRFQFIRWREPMHAVLGVTPGWLCRFCVAEHGLRGNDTESLFTDYDEAKRHVLSHLEEQ